MKLFMLFYLVLYSKKIPIQQTHFLMFIVIKYSSFGVMLIKLLLSPVLINWVISNFYIIYKTVQNN